MNSDIIHHTNSDWHYFLVFSLSDASVLQKKSEIIYPYCGMINWMLVKITHIYTLDSGYLSFVIVFFNQTPGSISFHIKGKYKSVYKH